MKTIVQSNFIDGVSEDDRIAGASQYAYGENIDVSTKPDFVQLSKRMTSSISTSDNVYNLVEIKKRGSTTKVLALSNDNIYHADNATPVYTNAAMNQLKYPAFVLGDYFYWVHSTGATANFSLNRTTLTDAISSTWSPTIGYKTLNTNDNFNYSSQKVIEKRAYMTLGNVINIYDYSDGSVLESTIISEEIVGIADTYGALMVFTEDGIMYMIDYLGETIFSSVDIKMKPSKVFQYGTQIYLLGGGKGTEKGLYYFDGRIAQPIYTQRYSGVAGKYKFYFESGIQGVTSQRDNLYLTDRDDDGFIRLCMYGNEISGKNKGIHYINTVNNAGNELTNIDSVLYSDDTLYIGWSTSSADGVDKITPTNGANQSGYLITSVRDYETGILRKNFSYVAFRVRDVDSTHTIKLSVSQDSGAFIDIRTINSMPDKGVVIIRKNEFVSAGVLGDFEDLSFKFTLSSDDNSSPKIFKGFALQFEQLNVA